MKHAREGGFLIARIHQLSGRILARKLKEQGIEELNPAQGRIMFALWRTDGISISELARQTSLGPSTLTSMLDRLESSGLLRRAPAPGDRRKILVWRAAKDRALQATYARISKEMTELCYRGLTQTEVDRFEGDLRRILRNLSGR